MKPKTNLEQKISRITDVINKDSSTVHNIAQSLDQSNSNNTEISKLVSTIEKWLDSQQAEKAEKQQKEVEEKVEKQQKEEAEAEAKKKKEATEAEAKKQKEAAEAEAKKKEEEDKVAKQKVEEEAKKKEEDKESFKDPTGFASHKDELNGEMVTPESENEAFKTPTWLQRFRLKMSGVNVSEMQAKLAFKEAFKACERKSNNETEKDVKDRVEAEIKKLQDKLKDQNVSIHLENGETLLGMKEKLCQAHKVFNSSLIDKERKSLGKSIVRDKAWAKAGVGIMVGSFLVVPPIGPIVAGSAILMTAAAKKIWNWWKKKDIERKEAQSTAGIADTKSDIYKVQISKIQKGIDKKVDELNAAKEKLEKRKDALKKEYQARSELVAAINKREQVYKEYKQAFKKAQSEAEKKKQNGLLSEAIKKVDTAKTKLHAVNNKFNLDETEADQAKARVRLETAQRELEEAVKKSNETKQAEKILEDAKKNLGDAEKNLEDAKTVTDLVCTKWENYKDNWDAMISARKDVISKSTGYSDAVMVAKQSGAKEFETYDQSDEFIEKQKESEQHQQVLDEEQKIQKCQNAIQGKAQELSLYTQADTAWTEYGKADDVLAKDKKDLRGLRLDCPEMIEALRLKNKTQSDQLKPEEQKALIVPIEGKDLGQDQALNVVQKDLKKIVGQKKIALANKQQQQQEQVPTQQSKQRRQSFS